jgi:hypothetical protein
LQQDPEFPAAVEARPTDDRARWRIPIRRKVAGLVGAAVLTLALVVGLLAWLRPDGPEDVVEAYLTAILDREVDEALRIAKTERPSGESGSLLTAMAISDGWGIGTTTAQNVSDDRAEVMVSLIDTGGGPAVDPTAYLGTFQLENSDDGWRITNPFVTVSFGPSPLWYVELGGLRLPREQPTSPGDPGPTYQVFPGIYRSHAAHSDLVTVTPERMRLVPGSDRFPNSPELVVTEQGNRAFQQASDAFLDECLAAQAKPDPGCVLDVARGHYDTRYGYVLTSDVRTSSWALVRRPAVNLPGPRAYSTDGLMVFDGQVTIPGELRLTATGPTLDGGRRVSFTMACLVTDQSLVAGFRADGSMSTTWLAAPERKTEPSIVKRISLDCY